MADTSTVEQRLAALEALLLDPQTMRNRLERTFDPRGGEPRVVDSTGRTMPYEPAWQFLNCAVTVDPRKQRIIITPAGGGGGMAGEFSDDSTTSDGERIKFVGQDDPTKNHLTLDTKTSGDTRVATLLLTENAASVGAAPFTALGLQQNTPDLNARVDLVAEAFSSGDVRVQIEATHLDDNSQGKLVLHSDSDSGATVALSARAASSASVSMSALDDGLGQSGSLGITPGSGGASLNIDQSAGAESGRVLYDDLAVSNFMQVEASTTNASAVPRFARGPFFIPIGSVPAGTVASTTIDDARRGLDYVVVGGCSAGSGAEMIVWSWQDLGVNDVQINYTNLDQVNAHDVTFGFYVISTDVIIPS